MNELVLRAVVPLARDYAAHAGLPREEAALRAALSKDLAETSRLAAALMAAGALFMRAGAPLLFLGRLTGFGSLSGPEREELLGRLQNCGSPAVRGLFFGIKPELLALTYGDRRG